MVIRQAKFADLPRLIELLREMHGRSRYRDRGEVDEKAARSLLMTSMQRHGLKACGGTCVFVAEDQNIQGMIVGIADRVYHVGTKLWATDLYFYVAEGADPRFAEGLYDAFTGWAEGMPDVVDIRNGATDAIGDFDRVAQFYKRKGLKQVGVIHERRIR